MSALPRVPEMYFTVRDLAALWRFSERFVRDLVKRGELPGTLEIAGELRIPARSINAYADAHVFAPSAGVSARNIGELRRKSGAFSAVQTSEPTS